MCRKIPVLESNSWKKEKPPTKTSRPLYRCSVELCVCVLIYGDVGSDCIYCIASNMSSPMQVKLSFVTYSHCMKWMIYYTKYTGEIYWHVVVWMSTSTSLVARWSVFPSRSPVIYSSFPSTNIIVWYTKLLLPLLLSWALDGIYLCTLVQDCEEFFSRQKCFVVFPEHMSWNPALTSDGLSVCVACRERCNLSVKYQCCVGGGLVMFIWHQGLL